MKGCSARTPIRVGRQLRESGRVFGGMERVRRLNGFLSLGVNGWEREEVNRQLQTAKVLASRKEGEKGL